MTRPTDHDAAFEAELAALVPAAPPADLRRRVAEALATLPDVRPTGGAARSIRPGLGRWLAERVLWAGGGAAAGALAASLAFAPAVLVPGRGPDPTASTVPEPPIAASPAVVGPAEPPVDVAEEAVAWADAGVQFLDDRTPARVLRRVAVERHRPAGGAEYRVPREDIVLLPVALR